MGDSASQLMGSMGGVSSGAVRRQLGRRARDARLAARRSQADVATAAGVSVPTLQRFEAGTNVSFDVVVRVATALDSERQLGDLFPLPDLRTVDDVLRRRALPRRGRSR
jgi:transcriptional regulator with XRE-family HTH domain